MKEICRLYHYTANKSTRIKNNGKISEIGINLWTTSNHFCIYEFIMSYFLLWGKSISNNWISMRGQTANNINRPIYNGTTNWSIQSAKNIKIMFVIYLNQFTLNVTMVIFIYIELDWNEQNEKSKTKQKITVQSYMK